MLVWYAVITAYYYRCGALFYWCLRLTRASLLNKTTVPHFFHVNQPYRNRMATKTCAMKKLITCGLMFFILAASGMYAAPPTQETDKKALREQRREERRQKREERREERQQRKKSRKPRNPRFLYPQLILPRKLFTKKSRLLVSQSLFQSKKKRNRNLLRSKIKRILHLRKSYNHPNKPYLQLYPRLKLHILIQNQKKGIQYYGFYSSLDYLYF